MFRRAVVSLAAAAALSGAVLVAAAPLASAEPVPPEDPQARLLDDLNLLPVQACGLDLNLPILSEVAGPDAAAPANCSQTDNDSD